LESYTSGAVARKQARLDARLDASF
jgi:hypothetical protein